MKHVCRKRLTGFSSQPVLIDHIDRCQKQQPTNITFSWKDHLKFEDYHMKVPLPIKYMQISNVSINPQITPTYYINKFQVQYDFV